MYIFKSIMCIGSKKEKRNKFMTRHLSFDACLQNI